MALCDPRLAKLSLRHLVTKQKAGLAKGRSTSGQHPVMGDGGKGGDEIKELPNDQCHSAHHFEYEGQI